MTEVYETEKKALADGKPAENNLMTQLIRASLGEDGLTETEIYGNIFVFNFAGHDTTAHTIAFTVYLLATAPHVQDWGRRRAGSSAWKQAVRVMELFNGLSEAETDPIASVRNDTTLLSCAHCKVNRTI